MPQLCQVAHGLIRRQMAETSAFGSKFKAAMYRSVNPVSSEPSNLSFIRSK